MSSQFAIHKLASASLIAAALAASSAGAATTRAHLYSVPGSVSYGGLGLMTAALEYMGVPCARSAPGGMPRGSVSLFIDGTFASKTNLRYADGCVAASYAATAEVGTPILPFGRHAIELRFDGDAQNAASATAPQFTEVRPQFEGSPATGGTAIRAGFSRYAAGNQYWDCALESASAVSPQSLAAPRADLRFVTSLFSFRAGQCRYSTDWTLPPGTFPLRQRVLLEAPSNLPAGAMLWAFGATTDNAAPHWYSIEASFSGRFAQFLVPGPNGDSKLAGQSIDAIVGIAVPIAEQIADVQGAWWGGPAENGWGVSIAQRGSMLFNTFFVYDREGRPMWVVMPGGSWDSGHRNFTGDLYIPSGSWFGDYDASRLNAGERAGTATISFVSRDSATLTYSLQGVSGTRALIRQQFGVPDTPAFANHAALWWGGTSQNGWGLSVQQQERNLFTVWYTYDRDGRTAWYVMPVGAWTSAYTYSGTLYRTSSSGWLGATYNPDSLTVTPVGSLELSFSQDGSASIFRYTVDATAGSKIIERQPF